ncbi:hypothetical protein [Volucribacter amazonae]|nr:hypothetical protein [Volucribacter amazonae]
MVALLFLLVGDMRQVLMQQRYQTLMQRVILLLLKVEVLPQEIILLH